MKLGSHKELQFWREAPRIGLTGVAEIEIFVQRPAIETSDERIGESIARGGRFEDLFQVGLRPAFDVSING